MDKQKQIDKQQKQEVPLPDAVTHLLEECRMVLPGIQALFGFQLIAVLNTTFADKFTGTEKILHLVAMLATALAIGLIMTPAAYHRQTSPRQASDRFIKIASRLLLWAMVPLLTGICLDVYIIARLITNNEIASFILALVLLVWFATWWFVFPRADALRNFVSGGR